MSLIHTDHIARVCHEAARSQALIPDPAWDKAPRNTRVITVAAIEDYLFDPKMTDIAFYSALTQTGKVDTSRYNIGVKTPAALTAPQQSRVTLCKSIIDGLR